MEKIAFLSLCFLIASVSIAASPELLPQNPLEGRIVFESKGCLNCHSVNGVGGHIGPDFGVRKFYGSALELAAAVWNHSSRMSLKMKEMRTSWPMFTPDEFSRVENFLYVLRYLAGTGNVARGSQVFSEKKCSLCHSVGKKKAGGIALDEMKVYASPLYLAQAMWNHSPQMRAKMRSKGAGVPTFSSNEIVDLAAYLNEASYLSRREKRYLYPGNPHDGEKVFKAKKCYSCHVEKKVAPSLKSLSLNKSVTEIAGVMWNHAEKMEDVAKKMNIAWPRFEGNEMANLISYLYFMNTPEIAGSAKQGEQLFSQKGCADCHKPGNVLAPTLAGQHRFKSDNEFFAKLWNHVPKMEEALFARGEKLPTLSATEIQSIFLYLK